MQLCCRKLVFNYYSQCEQYESCRPTHLFWDQRHSHLDSWHILSQNHPILDDSSQVKSNYEAYESTSLY